MQEREKALRLQKERLQRELEEKKKKVGCWENGLHVGSVLSGERRAESIGKPGLYSSGSPKSTCARRSSVARGEEGHI